MNRATSPTGWAKNPDGTPGYTWNVITGCLNHVNGMCKGGNFPCYAYKLANTRLKERYCLNLNLAPEAKGSHVDTSNAPGTFRRWLSGDYADPFYPRFWPDKLDQPLKHKKPAGIFTCDMSDLFGIGVPEQWTWSVFNFIEKCPQHRFYLLTKQPQNLIKFSPFPDNCWVGVSATSNYLFDQSTEAFVKIQAKVKFISVEPLLDEPIWTITNDLHLIDWVIIGACTGTWREIVALSAKYPALTAVPWQRKWILQPKIEWVKDIIEAADGAQIPVFLKDNLGWPKLSADGATPFYKRCPSGTMELRQELPGECCHKTEEDEIREAQALMGPM